MVQSTGPSCRQPRFALALVLPADDCAVLDDDLQCVAVVSNDVSVLERLLCLRLEDLLVNIVGRSEHLEDHRFARPYPQTAPPDRFGDLGAESRDEQLVARALLLLLLRSLSLSLLLMRGSLKLSLLFLLCRLELLFLLPRERRSRPCSAVEGSSM